MKSLFRDRARIWDRLHLLGCANVTLDLLDRVQRACDYVAMKKSHVELQEMLLAISRGLLDDPRDIHIEFENTEPPTFRLCVPEPYLGRLIGKNGQTARAIRLLAEGCIHKHGERASIDIQANHLRHRHSV
jgi:predicted RNA-binding protein YlqC (UPF0109 family)